MVGVLWFWLSILPVVQAAKSNRCPARNDPHGIWDGSTHIADNYTLSCNAGFHVNVSWEPISYTIACPDSGEWEEDPLCVNIDDCASLRHECGAMGVCVDHVEGYRCICEKGYHLSTDSAGEKFCGGGPIGCKGHTCGAHGICVDLQSDVDSFDTGNTSSTRGFRCSCSDGYFDNGTDCTPVDCGRLTDQYGAWTGLTSLGEDYTLSCPGDKLISGFGNPLDIVTISCSKRGRWPARVPVCRNEWKEARDAAWNSARFWISVSCAVLCICGAALAAGLTMGLVSLSDFDMQLLMATQLSDCTSDVDRERLVADQAAAQKVQPLLKDHHFLLVTLLLLNSVANEALPIFLDQVVPSYLAVLLSVTCVLFFGEILPSAYFTGPSQLTIAASFAPLVHVLELLLSPVARPIAYVLDQMVGHDKHGPKYGRAELLALLKLHKPEPISAESPSSSPSSSPQSLRRPKSPDGSPNGDVELGRWESKLLLPPNSGSAPHAEPESQDLASVEIMLAQNCLQLGRMRVSQLRLDLHPVEAATTGGPTDSDPPSPSQSAMTQSHDRVTIGLDATVAEALTRLQQLPEGARAILHDADSRVKGSVSLEALLRAALVP